MEESRSDLYIVKKGGAVKIDTARKMLRAEPFTSGKLVWKQDHLLQIHYDVAHLEEMARDSSLHDLFSGSRGGH